MIAALAALRRSDYLMQLCLGQKALVVLPAFEGAHKRSDDSHKMLMPMLKRMVKYSVNGNKQMVQEQVKYGMMMQFNSDQAEVVSWG
jgi:hypothetical protein